MMRIYTGLLPIIVIPCGLSGFVTGMHVNMNKKHTSMELFANWVGYTSIGIMTGFAYPISFPLLAGYVLYKN